MARNSTQEATGTVERPEGAPSGAPLTVTTPKGAQPGPEVSNADVDLAKVSLDAAHSTTVPNPDPNPLGLVPAPGPSQIEVHGVPSESDEPANVGGEDGR
jgi:hypothetical protein